jgi:outer membrane murein-binding lipoprotein Lpp
MKPPPSPSLVNQIVVLTLALLVFGGTLGLGAVWARQGISQTANRSRTLEVKITDVERRIDEVTAQIAAAVNPDSLLKKNEEMKLALAAPREFQVQRVAESPELRLAAKRNRDVFFSVGARSLDTGVESGAPVSKQHNFRIITAALR